MRSGRVRATTSALTGLSVATGLVLVGLAARAGPQRIVDGSSARHPVRGLPPPSSLQPLHQLGSRRGQGTFHHLASLTWVGWVLRVAIVVVLCWLAYRGLRLLLDVVGGRAKPEPRPATVDFDVLDDPGELADEMRADAPAQRALLGEGSPRNAIVACWHRFEQQAGRVGLARRPWETSSEFTLRVLDVVSADEGAVARLERLYHEARFSQHPIDEDGRTAALQALEVIHDSLPVRVRAGG